MGIQGSWCYTREGGAASILSREPAVPGKIPGGVVRGPIPGSSGSTLAGCRLFPGRFQVVWSLVLHQRGSVIDLFIQYIAGQVVVFVYNGVNPYSHQRPWGDGRFDGRKTPVERLRRHLRDCRHVGSCLEGDTLFGRLVSAISSTVGGLDWRSKAAASGRAASITTRVSGRAALGSRG